MIPFTFNNYRKSVLEYAKINGISRNETDMIRRYTSYKEQNIHTFENLIEFMSRYRNNPAVPFLKNWLFRQKLESLMIDPIHDTTFDDI